MIVIVYNFYDDPLQPERRRNLLFFLRHALVDTTLSCHVMLRSGTEVDFEREFPSVSVTRVENVGLCINGYKHALNHVAGIDRERYVFFINDSVVGPFTSSQDEVWYKRFTDAIDEGHDMVGSFDNGKLICTCDFMCSGIGARRLKAYLNTVDLLTPRDAQVAEGNISSVITDGHYNTKSKGLCARWDKPHTVYDAVFEKANRVGVNRSIFYASKGANNRRQVSTVTERELERVMALQDLRLENQ